MSEPEVPKIYRSLWYIFGEWPETGRVDISWPDDDVLTDVPRELADDLIKAHNEWLKGWIDDGGMEYDP